MNKCPSSHGHPAFLSNPFAFQSLLDSNGGNFRTMVDWAVTECPLETLKPQDVFDHRLHQWTNRLRANPEREIICLDLQRFFSFTSEVRASKSNVRSSSF